MKIIAGFPAGLLSLLESQNFGDNPKLLEEFVQPVVDLTECYLISKQISVGSVVAVPAANINVLATVPQGEVWRVNCGGAFVAAGVGVTLSSTPIVIVDGIVAPIGVSLPQVASTTRFNPMTCDPTWLKAGASLGVYLTELVGVPTVSGFFVVSRLRA